MESVLEMKSRLDDHQMTVLSSEMEKVKKSTGLAYVLWLFLGTLGIHKLYIGKVGMGITYLVVGAVAWIMLILSFAGEAVTGGYLTAAIVLFVLVGIFLLLDLFTIPRQIRKTYEHIEKKLISKMLGTE